MALKRTEGRIRFEGAKPMILSENHSGVEHPRPDQEQQLQIEGGLEAIAAYLSAAKALLNGRLAHLKPMAPPHLANPGSVLLAASPQGMVVRFEANAGESKVAGTWIDKSLAEVASLLSQRLIRLHTLGEPTPSHFDDTDGVTFTLTAHSPSDRGARELLSVRVVFEATWDGNPPPGGLTRLGRILGIQNHIVLALDGDTTPADGTASRRFIVHVPARLPYGWESIQVFPNGAFARKEFAEAWAETDILAAVVARQTEAQSWQALDPLEGARRKFAALFEEFELLLKGDPAEEELHKFLATHPELLVPSLTRSWSKLPLGKNVTDFVIQEATGDYFLVELEKSSDRLLLKNGHPSAKLTHAQAQVRDWRRYIEDNLRTVQSELGLTGLSTNPRSIVVVGRSRDLSPEQRRKLTAMQNENQAQKMLTYDDVLSTAKAVIGNLLGPIWDTGPETRVFYLPPRTAP